MARQNLTIEELLSVAEIKTVTKTELNVKELDRFCDEFNLFKGHDTVSLNLLYYHYYNWQRSSKLHHRILAKLLKSKFKYKNSKMGSILYLNKKKLNIDFNPITIMKANIFVRNIYEKENIKIINEVPGSNEQS
jgi:hypothetical protein